MLLMSPTVEPNRHRHFLRPSSSMKMSAAFSAIPNATLHVLHPTLLGGMLRSATLSPCTPCTLSAGSTTPLRSLGAILHVPIGCQVEFAWPRTHCARASSSSTVYSTSGSSVPTGLDAFRAAAAFEPGLKAGESNAAPLNTSIRRAISSCFLYIHTWFLTSSPLASDRMPGSKSMVSSILGPVMCTWPRENGYRLNVTSV